MTGRDHAEIIVRDWLIACPGLSSAIAMTEWEALVAAIAEAIDQIEDSHDPRYDTNR